ncbi:MAG TPA: MogA/MoaB family molybdenum cofactor biosynthesis protein [Syntrophorhabdaceae bacterium]|nr:MogA/MoaB family molybdenum cofactor biosynthesis protein [Syntrophorhabdaceae bacterium]
MTYKAAVITVSDKGARGERIDTSGPAIVDMLKDSYEIVRTEIVPDEKDIIADTIKHLIDEENIDLIVTTGGTGVGKRDVTPEATRMVIEKDLPGFSEIMRIESYKITPHGIISRGICGIRGDSIIINLPGSPKAASECLSFIIAALPHAISKTKGDTSDCG